MKILRVRPLIAAFYCEFAILGIFIQVEFGDGRLRKGIELPLDCICRGTINDRLFADLLRLPSGAVPCQSGKGIPSEPTITKYPS